VSYCAIVIVVVMCVASQARDVDSSRAPSLLSAARNDLLDQALYRHPERMVSKIAASGAVGANAEWERGSAGKFFIEQQRYGAELVQAGIVRKDQGLIDQGWKLLKWGFARQASDGSFPGTGDPFHSTSLFVEAASRALLLHKQSGWDGSDKLLATYTPKAAAAARWLMRPEVAAKGRKNNQPYTHRRWILAAALGQTAALSEDPQMARAAAEYARDGLSLQSRQGVNPEKGGADVSYQAVGILMAERYYTVSADNELRRQVKDMIVLGLRWELTNVDSRGHVLAEGSTRTGVEKGREGTVKSVDYKTIAQALTFGTAITDDAKYQDTARQMAVAKNWLNR
jgi:hypothetical protein